MVSVDNSCGTPLYNRKITSTPKNQKVEEFIDATNKEYDKTHNPTPLKKVLAYPTIMAPILGAFIGLGLIRHHDVKKAKKVSQELLKQTKNKYLKAFGILAVASAIITPILVHFLEKKT